MTKHTLTETELLRSGFPPKPNLLQLVEWWGQSPPTWRTDWYDWTTRPWAIIVVPKIKGTYGAPISPGRPRFATPMRWKSTSGWQWRRCRDNELAKSQKVEDSEHSANLFWWVIAVTSAQLDKNCEPTSIITSHRRPRCETIFTNLFYFFQVSFLKLSFSFGIAQQLDKLNIRPFPSLTYQTTSPAHLLIRRLM